MIFSVRSIISAAAGLAGRVYQDPSEEHLSDCVVLSSNANITYQGSAPHEDYGSSIWNSGESSSSEGIGLNGWILGESSSSDVHNQVYQNDPVSEGSRATRLFVERTNLSSESPSLDNNNVEIAGRDDSDDDDDDERPRSLLDSRRPSCKRKALETSVGQSSRCGTSSSGSTPTDTSQHPVFTPVSEISNTHQTTSNWGLNTGNIGVSGNVAFSSVFGLSAGVVPLGNSPQYPRRPSGFGRRSLIPPSGNQDSNYSSLHSAPASSSSDMILPSGPSSPGHHRLHSRAAALLLERHLGSTHSSNSLAASGEGRSRLISGIRNVLDRMRRGEGLRVEDVMILDQFGMVDFHDRHRDMRLDVDNMSYEELLALGERIGNVSTGLSEEVISNRLKQRKHTCVDVAEPCCICQEEYNDGEDLGILQCGHDFHNECINQWLMQKNLCPICKKTGLST